MEVSLIVVSYNSEELLDDFFNSVPDALDGVDPYEVIVVDNGSTDGSVELSVRHASHPKVVPVGANRGYSAAINIGVANSSGRYVFVLNDDIRLHPGAVRTLIEAFDDRTGIAVPKLFDGQGRLLRSLRRRPTVMRALGEAVLGGDRAGRRPMLGEVVQDEQTYLRGQVVDWASGCAWLLSRECLDEVGPWDESFFLYAEDTDYALRAGDVGYKVKYVPEARATHLVGPSHRDPRLWSMSVWNRYRLFRRRNGKFESGLFRLALLLGEGLRAVGGRPIHGAAAGALLFESKRPIEVR